jgi:peptidoglycan/LPS O-acetylase OafA/YrhL
MYLVLPLFFIFLRRFNRVAMVLALWTGATILGVISAQPIMPRAFHLAIFPPTFIAGMVAYQMLTKERRRILPAWGWPIAILGLFVLEDRLIGGFSYDSSRGAAVHAVICLGVALAIPAFKELSAHWIVLPAQQIAKYSYGIYLLHIPALMFVLRYLPGLPLAFTVAVFFALTALLSFVTFHLLENPLIQLGKRLTRNPSASPLSSVSEHGELPRMRPTVAIPLRISLADSDAPLAER